MEPIPPNRHRTDKSPVYPSDAAVASGLRCFVGGTGAAGCPGSDSRAGWPRLARWRSRTQNPKCHPESGEVAMQLNSDIYPRIAVIQWLSHCADRPRPMFSLPVLWVEDRAAALQSRYSPQWAGAITAAQGRLTGYLAKHHYDAYGAHWNLLARESRTRVNTAVGTTVEDAIRTGGWPDSLAHSALPPVDRALRASLVRRSPICLRLRNGSRV